MMLDTKLSLQLPTVLLVMNLRLDLAALPLTSDGDQESHIHLLLSNYQNVLVPLTHQAMVSQMMLDTRPSLQLPTVLLVTNLRLDPDVLPQTLDGDQVSHIHLLLSKLKDYQNALVPLNLQVMVFHTLLVIRPSLQPPMVRLVTNFRLVLHALLLILDGVQENQYQEKCQKILLLCKLVDQEATMLQSIMLQLIP